MPVAKCFLGGLCASHDIVIAQFGHCVKVLKPGALPRGLCQTRHLITVLETSIAAWNTVLLPSSESNTADGAKCDVTEYKCWFVCCSFIRHNGPLWDHGRGEEITDTPFIPFWAMGKGATKSVAGCFTAFLVFWRSVAVVGLLPVHALEREAQARTWNCSPSFRLVVSVLITRANFGSQKCLVSTYIQFWEVASLQFGLTQYYCIHQSYGF